MDNLSFEWGGWILFSVIVFVVALGAEDSWPKAALYGLGTLAAPVVVPLVLTYMFFIAPFRKAK